MNLIKKVYYFTSMILITVEKDEFNSQNMSSEKLIENYVLDLGKHLS